MEEVIKNLQAFLNEEAENFDREAFLREQYMYDAEQKGLKRGIKQAKLKIAKNMLSNNYEITEIRKVTGLSLNKINELKKEM